MVLKVQFQLGSGAQYVAVGYHNAVQDNSKSAQNAFAVEEIIPKMQQFVVFSKAGSFTDRRYTNNHGTWREVEDRHVTYTKKRKDSLLRISVSDSM